MPATTNIGLVGARIKRRVVGAFALCTIVPLLVLAYVMRVYVIPVVDSHELVTSAGVQALVFFTLLGMAAGGWIIWSVGHTIARMAERMSRDPKIGRLEHRTDEVGAIMANFAKMFETIEAQANEINTFAMRLDAAYKELEGTNARLKETSFKDEVTGLYNRRFFTIRLEEEISRHRRFNHPVSIVLLDLDGFKAVNDDLGHAVGDETLRDIAQILVKHSRGINVVSRYGGDEFAVLLVETSKTGARLYADRIREVIAKFRFSHGKRITASLGVASLPEDDVSSAEDLFKLADEALYAAKRGGKNRVAASDAAEKEVPWNAATS